MTTQDVKTSETTQGKASPTSTTEVIESINPGTGDVIGSVPNMGAAEVERVVDAARATASSWSALDLKARSRHLRTIRQAIVDRGEELAQTISKETGKPIADAWFEVMVACLLLTYAAHTGPKALRPRSVPSWPMVVKKGKVHYSPYGVVGVISPWNYPLVVPMQAAASALGAGNVVVLKPSELTPLTGVLLGEVVASAGPDLIQVVTGDGRTGEALVRSGVDKVSFTGSPLTGKRIMAAASDSLTPVVMELGGKDPMIVCDDADVERAARAAVGGAFGNSGQTCIAVERLFATPGAYEPLMERVVQLTEGLRQGPEPDAQIGAITRPPQIEVIEGRLADAKKRGARILTGGGRRTDLSGSFFAPTVVADVSPDMELMREETFGPVLPVMRVKTVEEAVRLANDCNFGLNSSVFTRDAALARRVAEQLVTGGVNVNDALLGAGIPSLPFGGEKWSGFGRVHGVEGLREFSRTKTVVADRVPGLPSIAGMLVSEQRPKPEKIGKVLRVAYSTGIKRRIKALRS